MERKTEISTGRHDPEAAGGGCCQSFAETPTATTQLRTIIATCDARARWLRSADSITGPDHLSGGAASGGRTGGNLETASSALVPERRLFATATLGGFIAAVRFKCQPSTRKLTTVTTFGSKRWRAVYPWTLKRESLPRSLSIYLSGSHLAATRWIMASIERRVDCSTSYSYSPPPSIPSLYQHGIDPLSASA
tara:strand:- start:30 stop:608 length:579 start_codon:yes stop_codon:yes gene_type:complete